MKQTFKYVENKIRQKTFGVLSTVSPKGRPHSTGILYGVSPPESKFALYAVTSKSYVKVRNIRSNPFISFLIPFPHYYIRFAPSLSVYFQGEAELVPLENPEPNEVFRKDRFLRRMLEGALQSEWQDSMTFIKIKPSKKIICYGLGINILKLRNSHAKGQYSVIIPKDRRNEISH